MQIPPVLTENCSASGWTARRKELLSLFSEHVYGRTPDFMPDSAVCKQLEQLHLADGFSRETYALYFQTGAHGFSLRFSVYLPPVLKEPLACVLMINPFDRNPEVSHSAARTYGHLPYRRIAEEGYAAVMIYADDLCPDDPLRYREGLLQIAPPIGDSGWGAIGAWAWATSRVIDWLSMQARFDRNRIALAGCSRAGKTALWCAAQDPRVALVISNVSGCTGAALTRGKQGEHVKDITSRFPHWMCKKYASYADREDALPVDQHMLLALCAPRPLYVSSASEDDWADPRKEFESCVLAGSVYRLLGADGLPAAEFPPLDTPLYGDRIGYHIRTGAHGCQTEDWDFYLPFIARYFKP